MKKFLNENGKKIITKLLLDHIPLIFIQIFLIFLKKKNWKNFDDFVLFFYFF